MKNTRSKKSRDTVPLSKAKTLRYRSCEDTPTAATVAAVTTGGGVSLLICKNILFCFCTPPCDPRPWRSTVVTHYVAAVGVHHKIINYFMEFIVTWAVATYQTSELAGYLLAHTYKSTSISKLSSSYRYQ